MEDRGKVFKYRLDFYYQQALIYLVTLILYTGIRGNFIEDRFAFVFRDPILYIIILFVFFSFLALVLNRVRDRRLIITEDRIIFKNRFEEQVIPLDDIEWVRIGRERRVQTGGRFQVIQVRLKRRFRVVRIRVGRYDHEKELVQEMQQISSLLPPPSHAGRGRIGTRRTAAQRHTLRT
jgi:hypothetical protein